MRSTKAKQTQKLVGPRVPNLFLIGSMKSGTSYLGTLLGTHPAIFMCPVKEPCYFVDQRVLKSVWYARWQAGHWRSLDRYLSLFAAAGDAPYLAEASTPYSQVPLFAGVPERILALSPEARFVYIMRDPIERTISHYWHVVRWWGERRDMLTAIRREPRYQDVSHYARQLKTYLRHIDAGRIYTVTLEALSAQPVAQLRALYSWLGIDASLDAVEARQLLNEVPDEIEQARGLGLLHRLRRLHGYSRISSHVPSALRRLGSHLAERSVRPAEVHADEVVRYLRPRQQEQTEELRALLGRDFPEWKNLYAVSDGAHQTAEIPPRAPAPRGRQRIQLAREPGI